MSWWSAVRPALAAAAAVYGLTRLLRWAFGSRRRIELRDKSVLVTGASSGLGRELACQLHVAGARLVLTARSIDKLDALCAELREAHPESPAPAFRYLDLAEPNGIAELAQLANDGRFDILINNAGMGVRASCAATSMQVHRHLMEVNYFGQVAVTQALLPLTRADGCVVVVGSVQGRIAVPQRAAYTAAKHALQAYFDCLRAETAASGLHVLFVSPAHISTDLSRHAVTGDGRQHGKLDATTAAGLSAQAAAAAIINALERGEQELILSPLKPRVAIALRYLFPDLFFRVMAHEAARQLAEPTKED